MRKIVLIIIGLVAAIALVGCGGGGEAAPTGFAPNQTAVAYAYTHGGYVGQATVTTDAEGTISVVLDEAFLPHTLAEVDIESDEWTEENTANYAQRGDTVYVARYISYNGTVYVGTTVGGAMIYTEADENGMPVGGQDLEQQIIRNQNTMAAWYDNIAAGGFAIHTGLDQPAQPVTQSPYGGLTKLGANYWNFGDLGWQGNMDAIQQAAIEIGTGFNISDMNRNSDNFWELGDAVTGATASDFVDYFNVIQNAVGRLAMQ